MVCFHMTAQASLGLLLELQVKKQIGCINHSPYYFFFITIPYSKNTTGSLRAAFALVNFILANW